MVAQGGAGPGDWQDTCVPIFFLEHHFPSKFAFPALPFTSGGSQYALHSLVQMLAGASLCALANYWLELSAADTCLSGGLHDT